MSLRLAIFRFRLPARFVGAFALLGSVAIGCTVFDGLTVPPAVIPYPGYLSLEDGVRACRLVRTCPQLAEAIARSISVPASISSFSTCLSWIAGPLPANRFGIDSQANMLECVAIAETCLEAFECAYVEPLEEGDARCSGVVGDQCSEAGMLVDCTTELAERCHSTHYGPGSECQLGLAGAGRCALAPCLPESSSPPRCTSGVYVRCDPGANLRVAKDCNTVGLTCPEGAEGADAQCATVDGVFPCDEPGRAVCSPDGSRARVCDGALASEFDCVAMGGSCSIEAPGARCIRPADTCTPMSAEIDTCQGNVISLCVGGARVAFDCGAVELSCIPPSAGHSGYCG